MANDRTPEIAVVDGVTVISLGPEYENLDEHRLEDVERIILETARTVDPPLLVLDLSHTSFFGSAFIEILFRVWNRLNARQRGRFAISGLTKYCAEVVQITHLDRLWPIYPTREEAIQGILAEKDA